jgi:acyl carrier protein
MLNIKVEIMEDFLDGFVEILEETDRDVLTSDTKFKDLDEWDSMTALMLIAMFDEKYDKKITGVDIKESNTLNDLFEISQK